MSDRYYAVTVRKSVEETVFVKAQSQIKARETIERRVARDLDNYVYDEVKVVAAKRWKPAV